MEQKKRYRYQGVNYFRKEDKDIFCGRKDDAEKLYTQVMLSNTMVLHAESGTGKSSLIQAGLIPILEENHSEFVTITLRFDAFNKKVDASTNQQTNLLEQLIAKVKDELTDIVKEQVPYINNDDDNLWVLAKRLSKQNQKLLLIFDQFEELQGFNSEQILQFKKGLAELLNTDIPDSVLKQIKSSTSAILSKPNLSAEERKEYNDNLKFLEKSADTKVIFVVREDKLGTMSLLSDYFPDILKNDYFIKQLSIENARRAIVEPAALQGDFVSSPFKFESEALVDKLLNELADGETKLVDPIQIQIVCTNLEKEKVIKEGKTIIVSSDIPPIMDIINVFYKNCWKQIDNAFEINATEFNKIRKEYISNLIVNDRRNLVHSDLLITETTDAHNQKITDLLLSLGLIRVVLSGKDKFYQLCHDRFIKPVADDVLVLETIEKSEAEKLQHELEEKARWEENEKRLIKESKRRRYIVSIGATLLILSLGFGLWGYSHFKNKATAEKQQRILTILQTLRRTNPTLSYKIARQWSKEYDHNEDFEKFLAEFDSEKFTYSLKSFPAFGDHFKDLFYDQDKQTLEVIYKDKKVLWDIKKRVILRAEGLAPHTINIKKVILNNIPHTVQFNSKDNYIEFINDRGISVKKFDDQPDWSLFSITNQAKFVVIGKAVYNYSTKELIAKIPSFGAELNTEITAAELLNDNKHLALGYKSGHKVILRIQEGNGREPLRLVAIYPPSRNVDFQKITCLASDFKSKYLVAGNEEGETEVWVLDSLSQFDILKGTLYQEVKKKHQKRKPRYSISKNRTQIKKLSISPDSKQILRIGEDGSVILWDFNSKESVVYFYDESIAREFGTFSSDGKKTFLVSKDGRINIFSKEKVSHLFNSNLLENYSPFDYYNVGLGIDDEFSELIHDTAGFNNMYMFAWNGMLNLPLVKKNYLGDNNFLENYNLALNEINEVVQRIAKRPEFLKQISSINRAEFIDHYYTILRTSAFFEESNDLELQSKIENIYKLMADNPSLFESVKPNTVNQINEDILAIMYQSSSPSTKGEFSSKVFLPMLEICWKKNPSDSTSIKLINQINLQLKNEKEPSDTSKDTINQTHPN